MSDEVATNVQKVFSVHQKARLLGRRQYTIHDETGHEMIHVKGGRNLLFSLLMYPWIIISMIVSLSMIKIEIKSLMSKILLIEITGKVLDQVVEEN